MVFTSSGLVTLLRFYIPETPLSAMVVTSSGMV